MLELALGDEHGIEVNPKKISMIMNMEPIKNL